MTSTIFGKMAFLSVFLVAFVLLPDLAACQRWPYPFYFSGFTPKSRCGDVTYDASWQTAFGDEVNEWCYVFVNDEKYWRDADAFCKTLIGPTGLSGIGRLAILNSSSSIVEVQKKLASIADSETGAWIGSSRCGSAASGFCWTGDKPVGQDLINQFWSSTLPAESRYWFFDADCILLQRESNWQGSTYPCNIFPWKYPFLCQFPMLPPLPTTTTRSTNFTPSVNISISTTKTSTTSTPPTTKKSLPTTSQPISSPATTTISTSDASTSSTDGNISVAVAAQMEHHISHEGIGDESDSDKIMLIGLTVGLGSLVLIIVVILGCIIQRRRRNRVINSEEDDDCSECKENCPECSDLDKCEPIQKEMSGKVEMVKEVITEEVEDDCDEIVAVPEPAKLSRERAFVTEQSKPEKITREAAFVANDSTAKGRKQNWNKFHIKPENAKKKKPGLASTVVKKKYYYDV